MRVFVKFLRLKVKTEFMWKVLNLPAVTILHQNTCHRQSRMYDLRSSFDTSVLHITKANTVSDSVTNLLETSGKHNLYLFFKSLLKLTFFLLILSVSVIMMYSCLALHSLHIVNALLNLLMPAITIILLLSLHCSWPLFTILIYNLFLSHCFCTLPTRMYTNP